MTGYIEKSLQDLNNFATGWDMAGEQQRDEMNMIFKSVLTADKRKELPKKDFGVKGKDGEPGRFPMPDKEHARLALDMLDRAKHLNDEQKAHIRKKAQEILGVDDEEGTDAK